MRTVRFVALVVGLLAASCGADITLGNDIVRDLVIDVVADAVESAGVDVPGDTIVDENCPRQRQLTEEPVECTVELGDLEVAVEVERVGDDAVRASVRDRVVSLAEVRRNSVRHVEQLFAELGLDVRRIDGASDLTRHLVPTCGNDEAAVFDPDDGLWCPLQLDGRRLAVATITQTADGMSFDVLPDELFVDGLARQTIEVGLARNDSATQLHQIQTSCETWDRFSDGIECTVRVNAQTWHWWVPASDSAGPIPIDHLFLVDVAERQAPELAPLPAGTHVACPGDGFVVLEVGERYRCNVRDDDGPVGFVMIDYFDPAGPSAEFTPFTSAIDS